MLIFGFVSLIYSLLDIKYVLDFKKCYLYASVYKSLPSFLNRAFILRKLISGYVTICNQTQNDFDLFAVLKTAGFLLIDFLRKAKHRL